jgi:hypothetical protein
MCPNDDLDDVLRSSYGDISTSLTVDYPDEAGSPGSYMSRYTWNYWGYDENGEAFKTWQDAKTFIDGADSAEKKRTLLRKADSTLDYDPITNPIKNSLSNRATHLQPRLSRTVCFTARRQPMA